MMDQESLGEPVVWLNGEYYPLSRAAISPLDRGFQYGDGIFETMRAECGRVLDLEKHLERMKRSLADLRIPVRESPGWERIVTGLLTRNDLDRASATVKIIVTRGVSHEMGLPLPAEPTVFASCRRFVPPTEATYQMGWRLLVDASGHAPPLAGHKTLNYLYFLKARQAALEQGADESIILDPFGQVSETAAGSLLARTRGRWWTPDSPFQLPSVTLASLVDRFAAAGHTVAKYPASLADLEDADTIWVVSSLILIMPATHVAGRALPNPAATEAAHWRNILLTAP